jgi:hypothetical protein
VGADSQDGNAAEVEADLRQHPIAVARRLRKISPIVTPDTLLRRYRELVAQKYDGSAARGPGDLGLPVRFSN